MSEIIPSTLIERIQNKKVVLFLGAGASLSATSKDGKSCPKGCELAKIISDKFLGGKEKDKSLSTVAEYAIEEHSLVEVQEFIKDIFNNFEPAYFHKILPSFYWAGIFTTNYDLIIERAYDSCDERCQDLVPVTSNKDRIDQILRTTNSLPYNKLHGCISNWSDTTTPLIFTVDQYVDHKTNRSSLFNRLLDYGREYTFVFVGYSLEDPDIRQALLELNKNIEDRPRYYTVTPTVNRFDMSRWSAKRITTIEASFEDFLNELNSSIDPSLRAFSRKNKKSEVESKFIDNDDSLSSDGLSLLSSDAVYIHSGMNIEASKADNFFKGDSSGWGAIEANYDFKRLLNDQIISDAILIEESDRASICDLYLLSGHAGSGKTCSLKRIAWDAAFDFDKLCFFVDSSSRVNMKPFMEIVEKCGERIYIFIDKCSMHLSEVKFLVQNARKQNLPITIFIAERQNEWNVDCVSLHGLVSESWKLPYLKEKEIQFLLDKLEKYNCLGLISGLSRKEQEKAFRDKANRQLLVALYEVTYSKPFEDIVYDEYKNIEPEKARLIYRTICALNRWGIPVRAGLIHRIFDINFNLFKRDFFLPLENIVQVRVESYGDYAYQARHPYIAEFVFDRSFDDLQDRFDLIMDILSCLDLGYGSDNKAFKELIKANNLMRQFKDPNLIRKIYEHCKDIANESDYYHQQIAIFEMKRDNPNFDKADKHLDIAESLNPSNTTIMHSRSLLRLNRAKSSSGLEKERLLSRASEFAQKSISTEEASTEYGYQTLCEIAIVKLKDYLDSPEPDTKLINEKIKEIEQNLSIALQKFPKSEFITTTEASFKELIGESEQALEALENAFKANDASPFIASALAKIYLKKMQVKSARIVLETLLSTQPADKFCNGLLGMILAKHAPEEDKLALQHLRRSFTKGDFNYYNQFWYARQLYLSRMYEESIDAFRELSSRSIDPDLKNKVMGHLKRNGQIAIFEGNVIKVEPTYAFVNNIDYPGSHFLHKDQMSDKDWDKLSLNSKVKYNLGFSFKGPVCSSAMLM